MFLAVLVTSAILASGAIVIYKAPPAETCTAVGLLDVALLGAWAKLRRPLNAPRRPSIIRADLNYSNKVRGKGVTFQLGVGTPSSGSAEAPRGEP